MLHNSTKKPSPPPDNYTATAYHPFHLFWQRCSLSSIAL